VIITKLIRTNVAIRFPGAAVQMGQWLLDTVEQWLLDTVDLTGVVSQRHVSWVEGILLIDKLTRKTSLCSPQKCTAQSCIAFVNEETNNLSCPCTVCCMCITPVLFFNTTIRSKFYIFSPNCVCKTFFA
jgi:hypothetical protein